jgi:hypothetical protein
MDHFSPEEKSCPCCGLNLVDRNQDFLQALNTARELFGKPMDATSMTRCAKHNRAIGGVPNSAHCDGRAADIACNDPGERIWMVKAFIAAGFDRIEVSPVHIHVDKKLGAAPVFLIKTESGLV